MSDSFKGSVFTDGAGGSSKSLVTWKNPDTQKWESDVQILQGSPQIAELAARIRACEMFKVPLSLVTALVYVAGVAQSTEHALLKEVGDPNL